jgi:hypothetical protein
LPIKWPPGNCAGTGIVEIRAEKPPGIGKPGLFREFGPEFRFTSSEWVHSLETRPSALRLDSNEAHRSPARRENAKINKGATVFHLFKDRHHNTPVILKYFLLRDLRVSSECTHSRAVNPNFWGYEGQTASHNPACSLRHFHEFSKPADCRWRVPTLAVLSGQGIQTHSCHKR